MLRRRVSQMRDVRSGRLALEGRSARRGFTLIEVIIASAILLVVSVGFLRFSITANQWGSNLVVRSMAQNLAELTAEQLAGSSVTEIGSLVSGAGSADFPPNGTTWPDNLDPSGVTVVSQPAGTYFARIPGEFLVTGITSFFPTASSQVDVPSSIGEITGLDERPGEFAKTGPVASTLAATFPTSLLDVPSSYTTFEYTLTPNVIVVPLKHVNGTLETWDSGLVLFKGEFPHFLREISISSLFTGTPSDATQVRYSYTVKVIWVFGGKKQMVAVGGERSGVY